MRLFGETRKTPSKLGKLKVIYGKGATATSRRAPVEYQKRNGPENNPPISHLEKKKESFRNTNEPTLANIK